MKYLILGKNGQLGTEFVTYFEKNNIDFMAFGHNYLDISDFNRAEQIITTIKPDVVINATAYNNVDLAEKEYEQVYKTNAIGPYNISLLQKKHPFLFIHYSTDYVFDGGKTTGLYTEQDIPNPISQYGKSKHFGETLLNNLDNTLIFRVSWLFGRGKQNFIYKLLEWSKQRDVLNISTNEVSIPTATKTIVEVTLKALEANLRGLYHLTSSDYCSRYDYAKYVCDTLGLKNTISPVTKDYFKLPAQRPDFSAMSNDKISKELGLEIVSWKDAVKEFLLY